MRYGLSCAAVALLVFVDGARVDASSIYEISGRLGRNLIGNAGLSGGSYTATFEVATPLPLSTGGFEVFESYRVSLYNSSSTLVSTFGSTVPESTSRITNITIPFVISFDSAFFANPTTGAFLVLDFAPGFGGNGRVTPFIPTYLLFASRYSDLTKFNVVIVSSGGSSPVPEPSSIVTAGIGVLMLLGVRSHRRRARVAS